MSKKYKIGNCWIKTYFMSTQRKIDNSWKKTFQARGCVLIFPRVTTIAFKLIAIVIGLKKTIWCRLLVDNVIANIVNQLKVAFEERYLHAVFLSMLAFYNQLFYANIFEGKQQKTNTYEGVLKN